MPTYLLLLLQWRRGSRARRYVAVVKHLSVMHRPWRYLFSTTDTCIDKLTGIHRVTQRHVETHRDIHEHRHTDTHANTCELMSAWASEWEQTRMRVCTHYSRRTLRSVGPRPFQYDSGSWSLKWPLKIAVGQRLHVWEAPLSATKFQVSNSASLPTVLPVPTVWEGLQTPPFCSWEPPSDHCWCHTEWMN